jgi:hypothetical protein
MGKEWVRAGAEPATASGRAGYQTADVPSAAADGRGTGRTTG